MTQVGIGAMLHALGGGSENAAEKYYGRNIVSAKLTEERLTIGFDDGIAIQIWDDGQSCCESRYITTDDDVQSLVGNVLRRIEAKDGPNAEDDYGDHEQVFVEVGTDQGFITLVNHNEHNGYYGGFGLTITEAD
tara:strand:+ start:72 stop:473 length:402 start_codon:yes stop_codon:yes gene_type:complete